MTQDRKNAPQLLSWLASQEQVISFWIMEITSTDEMSVALVENLERHRRWLAARIEELKANAA